MVYIEDYTDSSKKDDVFAFSNLDHASNLTNWKFYQKVVFLVQKRAVVYKSEKLKLVALSIAKAEYIALSIAIKMAI